MTIKADETTLTVRMKPSQRDTLRELARDFGFTTGRGMYVNQGSIRQMMIAIADGDLVILPYTMAGDNGNE